MMSGYLTDGSIRIKYMASKEEVITIRDELYMESNNGIISIFEAYKAYKACGNRFMPLQEIKSWFDKLLKFNMAEKIDDNIIKIIF